VTGRHSPDTPKRPRAASSRTQHGPTVTGRRGELADLTRPRWLSRLGRRLDQRDPPGTGSARQAAILVVLVLVDDGEPELLLTQRSDGLGYLPGAAVFPGGSVERSDRTPVDTALREAHEETGLDPGSVEILGHLSERSTPDARFVVTPVVAWSRQLSFNAPISPDEVTAMGLVGLATLSPLRADNHVALRRIAGDGLGHYPNSALSGVLPPMTAAVVRELVGVVAAVRRDPGDTPEGRDRPGPE